MGRFFAVLLTLSLLLACAACGDKDAPSSQTPASGGGLVESQPESPPEPEETPHADDALVREMIFAYGAYEDTLNGPAVLTVRKKSLFHRMESWGRRRWRSWQSPFPFWRSLWSCGQRRGSG